MNAVDPDSDNDYLYDGLERGYGSNYASSDTDLSRPYFVPDIKRKEPFWEDVIRSEVIAGSGFD